MATRRLPMYIIREILRLKLVLGRSHREVARSLGVSAGKVGHLVIRARELGLDWKSVQELSDEALERRLHGPRSTGRNRPLPDPAFIHTELRRPGVTLELLHLEYLSEHPEDGYRYTAFCDHYRRWRDRQSPVMRQVHRPVTRPSSTTRASVRTSSTDIAASLSRWSSSSVCSERACWCTRRRPPPNKWPTGCKATCGCSTSLAGCREPSSLTSFEAPCEAPTATNLWRSGATRRWRGTIRARSCQLALVSRGTRPKWNRRCSSCSAGFWRGFATRLSFRSVRSISASASS